MIIDSQNDPEGSIRGLYIKSYNKTKEKEKSSRSISTIRIICHRHDDDPASGFRIKKILFIPNFSQYYFIAEVIGRIAIKGQKRRQIKTNILFVWWTQRLRHRRPSSLYNSFLLIYLLHIYRKEKEQRSKSYYTT